MARLEDLATGTRLTGLAASGSATVECVQWIGEQALKVIYRDRDGQLGSPRAILNNRGRRVRRSLHRERLGEANSESSSSECSIRGKGPDLGTRRSPRGSCGRNFVEGEKSA